MDRPLGDPKLHLKNLEASATAADPIKIDKNRIFIKIGIFQKSVKIGSWGGFGPILDPDSNSARKIVYITWFKSIFIDF